MSTQENKPLVSKCLTLSILHISEDLQTDLNAQSITGKLGPVSVYPYKYGYFLSVPRTTDSIDERLHPFFELAWKLDCTLIRFDEELVDPIKELPIFN